jgi:hypothetical protein
VSHLQAAPPSKSCLSWSTSWYTRVGLNPSTETENWAHLQFFHSALVASCSRRRGLGKRTAFESSSPDSSVAFPLLVLTVPIVHVTAPTRIRVLSLCVCKIDSTLRVVGGFFPMPVFRRKISRQERLGATIRKSADP